MSGPFNVIPNSNAARAVEEVARLNFAQITPLSTQLSPILERYGVDTVTRSAVETAADQLASRPGMDVPYLAQGLVGTAVSDPRVAANQAKAYVESQQGLTADQQGQLAITAAGNAAEDAGADRSSAEAAAADALSQGATPQMAAYAGAASAVSAAVSSHPAGSPGIEIFGYLKALVQGMVYETYLGKENKEVTLDTHWTMGDSFIQTTGGQLLVECREYRAEAKTDESVRKWSVGSYVKGYTMEAPAPVFVTVAGLSATVASVAAYSSKIISLAAVKEVLFVSDFYVALMGTTKTNVSDEDIRKRKDKFLVGIHARGRTNFS
jgi:hypothetical protein